MLPRVSVVLPRVSVVLPRVSEVLPRVFVVLPKDSAVLPRVSAVLCSVPVVLLMWSGLYGMVLEEVGIWGAAEFLAIRTETSVPRPAETRGQ